MESRGISEVVEADARSATRQGDDDSSGSVQAHAMSAATSNAAVRSTPRGESPAALVIRSDPVRALSVLARLAATGFLGIGYEVVVVRVLGQVTEDTVYTFAALLAVYLGGHLLSVNLDGERVPRLGCGRYVPDVVDDGAVSLHDAEIEEVALERVRADAEIGSVRRDGECDPRPLVDLASERIEANGYPHVALGWVALVDGERKEGEGLHSVE
jgi:hypothetical protein